MDSFEINVLKKVKSKISVSKFEMEERELKNNKEKVKKSIVAACLIIFSTAGIVFAKDIENYIHNFFSLRERHQSASDNGYIPEFDMDFMSQNLAVTKGKKKDILDNVETNLKINDFIMTDDYIELEMEMNFSDNINEYKDLNRRVGENIDYENFGTVELKEFFILDDENNLLAGPGFLDADEEPFNNFCKEHALPYKYREYSEHHIDNGGIEPISYPEEIVPEENCLKNLIFRINAYGNSFPKSKKLIIYFNKIAFIPKRYGRK